MLKIDFPFNEKIRMPRDSSDFPLGEKECWSSLENNLGEEKMSTLYVICQ